MSVDIIFTERICTEAAPNNFALFRGGTARLQCPAAQGRTFSWFLQFRGASNNTLIYSSDQRVNQMPKQYIVNGTDLLVLNATVLVPKCYLCYVFAMRIFYIAFETLFGRYKILNTMSRPSLRLKCAY